MCLSLGCDVTPNEHQISHVHELDIDAKYDEVDNNDGISVFDVTVPGEPRYALMQLSDYEEYVEDEDEGVNGGIDQLGQLDSTPDAFKANTILNASDYMLRYRERGALGASTMAQIQTLDALPQVDVAAFTSAWPHGKFRPRKDTNGSDSTAESKSLSKPANSLTETSMRTVIERAVQGDLSNVKLLAEAEQVPGFTESLRTYLRADPAKVEGEPVSILLGHVHRGCAIVDLSPFWLLSFENVLSIVEVVAKGGHAFSLALPDLEDLIFTGLNRLLSSGLVCELRVGKHRIGDLGQFVAAIDGTSVMSFNVPDLYSRGLARVDYPSIRMRKPWESPVPPLPRPKQFPITQLLFVQWPAARMPPTRMHSDWIPPWSEMLTATAQSIQDMEVTFLSLPMSDYFLSVVECIRRLPIFLSHLAISGFHGTDLQLGLAILGMIRRLSLKVS